MIAIEKSKDFNIEDVLRRAFEVHVPNAKEVLNECIKRSVHVYYGTVDGEVACAWGILQPTLLSDSVYLWLITTDIIAEHKFLFIRHSQRYVEELLNCYPLVVGDLFEPNEPARRWLKWLGAEFSMPALGRTPFIIRKKVH